MMRVMSWLVGLWALFGALGAHAQAACEARCTERLQLCAARCEGADKCGERCARAHVVCSTGCMSGAKGPERGTKARATPPDGALEAALARSCPDGRGGTRRCTEAEMAAYRAQLKELCPDPRACATPEGLVKQAVAKSRGAACLDDKGQVVVCPNKRRQVEAVMKQNGICLDNEGAPVPCE